MIYETHVKGFTMRHPDVPDELRGTYAGLASAPAVEYLVNLGVTAVELLPIHHIADESFLVDKGLSNYWGYSSIGYLAPHAGYSASGTRGEQLHEFKDMVKTLHRAGIEVIMDVVYNHTAEGNHLGPLLSFQGHRQLELLPPEPRGSPVLHGLHRYGEQPESGQPQRAAADHGFAAVLRARMPCGRLSVRSGGHPGARAVRRRPPVGVLRHHPPGPDPVGRQADRRALGRGARWLPGGQLPDPVDRVERGIPRQHPRLLARQHPPWPSLRSALPDRPTSTVDGRRPAASINFVTAHDGFTLADLVSYNDKHNEANLEDNRDGADDNRSWNCGAEGPTEDPGISALRARQQRNLLATVLLSQGVPMLLGGDEFGRSQGGNNNAWCQDSEISWFDWDTADGQLQAYTRQLIELRRTEPVFRRRDFLVGEADGSGLPDVIWFGCDGQEMGNGDWEREDAHALGVFLNGDEIPSHDGDGNPIEGRSFLLLFNAHHEPLAFTVPDGLGDEWETVIGSDPEADHPASNQPGDRLEINSRSLLILRRD